MILAALWAWLAHAAGPNLVLISMDTTRADALSCYGQVPGLLEPRAEVTPHLDALAAEGARFERFFAHAPTTLNSHTSMMTGLDPHGHAVPRNGFPLPEGVPTLAERLSAAGWDTVAVVAAVALEQPMGLDRGFDVYDDTMSVRLGPQFQDTADGVVRRTLAAVDARDGDAPLFLFVHFFDPHQPYVPPTRYRDRLARPGYAGEYRDRAGPLGPLRHMLTRGEADPADVDAVNALYLAEVAFMDAQLGVLLRELRDRGLLDRAIVVVTADHGEVLSETPQVAWSHGSDVTDGVMRVPLIVRGYGVPLAERAVIRRQAEMAGLAPTVLEALGQPHDLGGHASFYPLLAPGPVDDRDGWPERPTRPVVMEATRPFPEQGDEWNNLGLDRGVHAGGFTILTSPRRGIIDEAPGSEAIAAVLSGMLARWDALAPPFREVQMSDETRAALEALGYLE